MGWSLGENNEGRQVGYGVDAKCDGGGCDVEITLGLAYVCGVMHDGGGTGCGHYFCEEHRLTHPCEERDAEWARQEEADTSRTVEDHYGGR